MNQMNKNIEYLFIQQINLLAMLSAKSFQRWSISFILCVIFCFCAKSQKIVGLDQQNYRVYIGNMITFDSLFDADSSATLAFITCNQKKQLKITIQSALYYDTYHYQKVVIYQRCLNKASKEDYTNFITEAIVVNPPKGIDYTEYITVLTKKVSYGVALNQIKDLTKTQFLMVFDDSWHVTGPIGFAQRSIDVLNSQNDTNLFSVQFYPTVPLNLRAQLITHNRSKYFITQVSYSSVNAFMMDLKKWKDLNWDHILQDNQCETCEECEYQECVTENLKVFASKKNAKAAVLGGNYPQKVTKQADIKYLVQI